MVLLLSVYLLKLDEVIKRTARSRSSIYRDIDKGAFPAPVRLSEKSVAWRSDDITKWIESRHSTKGGAS